jgi:hypothetical protein
MCRLQLTAFNDGVDARRSRINTALDLIKNYDNYELALVENFDPITSAFIALNSEMDGGARKPRFGWVVDGKSRLFAEVQARDDANHPKWSQAKKFGYDRVGVIIDDPDIADAGRKLFRKHWSNIPDKFKRRREVIEILKGLRQTIPPSDP